MKIQFRITALLLLLAAFAFSACNDGVIMVFAPHEDDEAISSSGVIRNAIIDGDTVKLVMVTNGDYYGGREKALTRLNQTITAMEMLGLNKSDILYFGYADGTVLSYAYLDPTGTFTSTDGFTQQTYGFPEIDMPDYHYTAFGSHGWYNREDIFSDFYDVLDSFRPDHIYMPSPMETHRDHSATGLLAMEAMLELKKTITYAPVIHEYMIYRSGLPQSNLDPTAFVDNSEADMNSTPYAWELRESVEVPAEMKLPFESGNLKYNVLRAYLDNTGSYFDRFIKADEVFWKRDMSNIAYSATVSASSENVSTEQLAGKAIDGVIMGYPYTAGPINLYTTEWATTGELSGAWIRLTWSAECTINKIVLYDRPNATEHISSATLTFGDGSSEPVGPLPNNGSAYIVNLASPRTVSWIQLTVDAAAGNNIGLSEFEVF